MHITDPVADMLTRIRNALVARHESVEVPASNMKKAIAQKSNAKNVLENPTKYRNTIVVITAAIVPKLTLSNFFTEKTCFTISFSNII